MNPVITRNNPRIFPSRFCIVGCLILVAPTACHLGRLRDHSLPPEGSDLPILRQITRAHSHETRAMRIVIRDQAALARIPLTDVPVDFNKEMLLVVTLGRVPSDQYVVRIQRVWRKGGKLRVVTRLSRPAPDAPIVMASPYCIAIVPRCDLKVSGFLPEPPERDRTWSQSEWQTDLWKE